MEKENALNNLEKVAVVISSLPEDLASEIFRHLDTAEVEKISRCMSHMGMIAGDMVDQIIDEFAERFGRPKLSIALKDDVIKSVDVIRGSPCGSTHFAARKLIGMSKSEAATKGGLFVQTYPCLASRVRDPEYDKSLIHMAAYIAKNSILKS